MSNNNVTEFAALRAINTNQAQEIVKANAEIRRLKSVLEAAADENAKFARRWKVATICFAIATVLYAVSFIMQVLK